MKHKTGNSDLIKRINISNIIDILKTQGMKSRAELAILTGLTPASITKSTKKLIDLDILLESGTGKISGGRPPILLDINKNAGYILGIYLAPTKIKGILTSIKGEIISEETYILEKKDKSYILNLLFTLIKILIKTSKNKRILGIGIALNGMVDYDRGISIFSPHYHWKDFNLKKVIEEEFDIPTIIDNDVRAMALGTHHQGVGINESNFIIINIGEGIGAGIILNNKLYRGENYSAGEIGHVIVEKNSSHLCSCGNHGCLEALIGSKRVIEEIKIKIKTPNFYNEYFSLQKFYKSVNLKEPKSLKILEDISENLGYTLSFLVNLFNPKVIIIVGEINNSKNIFYDLLEAKVKKYALNSSTRNLNIIPSQLKGVDAATIGATILVYQNLFNGRKILEV
ncbi:MAG: ROK family protein [Psychrilyobacter sp.]|nr:ROK family protein [Psychrilyobacter sp.]